MYLLESLYRWTGSERRHLALTSVRHAQELRPRVPGLEWKLWVGEVESQTRGGYYLFDTEQHARAFEAQTLRSLAVIPGNEDQKTRLFVVRDDVSAVTGALGSAAPGVRSHDT
jgi:hypothetical protein